MADYARVGKDGPKIHSLDFVNQYSAELGKVGYAVRQLAQDLHPHCTGCEEETHLFDIKNLVAGVTRPPKRSIKINPGFLHYKADPDCPYSYKGDVRIRDHIDGTEYDKEERAFNSEKLNSPKVRAGIDAAVAWFLQPYAVSSTVPQEHIDTVLKNEKRFIFSMAGIGNSPWLVPFELMLLMPDRTHQIKNGKQAGKEKKIGFRPSEEKQMIILIDSHDKEHRLTRPEYIEFGFVQPGGRRVNPMLWGGEKCIFAVSRQGAIDLWRRGHSLVPAGGFKREVEKNPTPATPSHAVVEVVVEPIAQPAALSPTAQQIADYERKRRPFTRPKRPRRNKAAPLPTAVQPLLPNVQ